MDEDTRHVGVAMALLLLCSTGLILIGANQYLNYRNPYSYTPTHSSTLIAPSVDAKAEYTLMFVLDGVRYDVFHETYMPTVASFTDWANFTDVECSHLLSVSRVGYSVLSSGVNSSESEVISNDHSGPFIADSLWNTSLKNNGTTAFVGDSTWYELFGEWMNYSLVFHSTHAGSSTTAVNATSGESPIDYEIPAYNDSLVAEYAINIADRYTPSFMVVHFSETDEFGHNLGPLSSEYQDALERQDSYIGQILSEYDMLGILNSTLIIVASDHGQVAIPQRGGQHGGTEIDALHIPLLLRGPGIIPGQYAGSHHQTSIAPTISAIMGWNIPSDSSSSILFECLDFSTQEEAIYKINEASIRLNQAVSRATVMGYTTLFASGLTTAAETLDDARASFLSNAYETAILLAESSESLSRSILSSSWDTKISEEVSIRFIILATCFGLIAFAGYRQIKPKIQSDQALSILTAFLSSSLYFVLISFATSLTDWEFSASYIAAFQFELISIVIAVTLGSFLAGTGLSVLLLKIFNRNTNTVNYHRQLNRFLLTSVFIYFMILSGFVVFNGFGLPWYAVDVVIPLTYFFFILTAFFFLLYSIVAKLILHIQSPAKMT